MSFRASKSRKAKAPARALEGPQLIPNAGVRDWYAKELAKLVEGLTKDLHKALTQTTDKPVVQAYFAADASASRTMLGSFAQTRKALEAKFNAAAKKLAETFIAKTDKTSEAAIQRTVAAMGLGAIPSEAIPDFLSAQVAENVRLITGLSEDVFNKVERSVNLAIQSPSAGEQGMAGIFSALKDAEGMTKKRATLIARDQTHKVYASLNTERMRETGIGKFKWVHSSAGKKPRECHVKRNGTVYLLDGGPDELYHEDGTDANSDPGCRDADKGKPGYAINCRCRMVAVLDLDD